MNPDYTRGLSIHVFVGVINIHILRKQMCWYYPCKPSSSNCIPLSTRPIVIIILTRSPLGRREKIDYNIIITR